MKKFDLEAALNGEPVKLRNGREAYVVGKIPSNLTYSDNEILDYPLIGVILNKNGYLTGVDVRWTINGRVFEDGKMHDADIIGRGEEPKISIEDLPKPFKPATQEQYFTITSKYKYDPLYVEETANFNTPIDNDLINQGNAFRTREDAQKWLDFMKSMME